MVWRAPHSTPRVSGAAVSPLSLRVLAQLQPGGDQKPCLGEVEPDQCALAGKRALSRSQRSTISLADSESAGSSGSGQLEPGSWRGLERELAAGFAALINPQSVHLIPGSKPEPGREAGQSLLLGWGALRGRDPAGLEVWGKRICLPPCVEAMGAGFTWELQVLRAQQLSELVEEQGG